MPIPPKHVTSRRNFLKGSALAGTAGLLVPGRTSGKASAPLAKSSGQAKNLIFLVADGLCHGTLGLAHHWKLRHHAERLAWMQLFDRPDLHRATQDTASASSPVTDSAAAGSAWGCGQRIQNGSINVTADGTPLKPIMRYAKDAGKRTGLVSSCRITHATPAAFAANVAERDDEEIIAGQYLERGIDVLLGGGFRHFQNAGQDLLARYEAAGYRLARDRRSLQAASGSRRLLGLFSDSHLPYAIDRENDETLSGVPDLPTLFDTALRSMETADDGFVLQVEGGRVDHAGHANDPAAILREYLEFDRCIPIALDYMERHPDTLVIVTTDHGTGGCQLDGFGRRYNGSGPALDRINQFSASFEWLEKRYKKSGSFDPEILEKVTGIRATPEQAKAVQAAIEDPEVKYLTSKIAEIFAAELVEQTATGWSSNKHTSECVDLMALGPGADRVNGFMQNNQVFDVMTEALALV